MILEKLVLPSLKYSIKFSPHQHGFMNGRFTLTAMQDITNHIKTGLNKKKPADRTVLVATDLSEAFDTGDHEILKSDI